MPIYKQFHTPTGIIARELTKAEVLEFGELHPNPFYAIISGFTPAAEKPLAVTRTWEGYTFNFDCYVTQDLKDQYLAGDVAIGDIVIVILVDYDLTKPLATQKVFKTW